MSVSVTQQSELHDRVTTSHNLDHPGRHLIRNQNRIDDDEETALLLWHPYFLSLSFQSVSIQQPNQQQQRNKT